MWRNAFFLKLLVVLGLVLLLTVPLAMIRGLIYERQLIRSDVVSELAREQVGEQRLVGPILTIPYKRTTTTQTTSTDDKGRSKTLTNTSIDEGQLTFLPEVLDAKGSVATQEKYRGLHRVLFNEAALNLTGRFLVTPHLAEKNQVIEWGVPSLSIGVADPRGILPGLALVWNGADASFAPGSAAPRIETGVQATLPKLDMARTHDLPFAVSIKLLGMGRFEFLPVGKASRLSLQSAWPHPGFTGPLSPKSTVGPSGFSATWDTSHFATNAKSRYERCIDGGAANSDKEATCREFFQLAHGVSFVQPVDIYQQLERASKYGILFIGLTFMAFFLYELLKRLRVHPVQYTLVGAALAMFYVLLVSLSEQVAFAKAYTISASACVLLIGVYVAFVLRSMWRGALFTGVLAALYGALYILLQEQDHALLMGSILLFTILAGIMLGTRNVDWYRVASAGEQHD